MPRKQITPDIEFSGHGVYTLWANTKNGLDFILENVRLGRMAGLTGARDCC